jgi:hypothetical protein
MSVSVLASNVKILIENHRRRLPRPLVDEAEDVLGRYSRVMVVMREVSEIKDRTERETDLRRKALREVESTLASLARRIAGCLEQDGIVDLFDGGSPVELPEQDRPAKTSTGLGSRLRKEDSRRNDLGQREQVAEPIEPPCPPTAPERPIRPTYPRM